jgi:hypothetical protein
MIIHRWSKPVTVWISISILAPTLFDGSNNLLALSKAVLLFIGPISGFSCPGPSESVFVLSTISGIQSADSPTNTVVVMAMHLCPADPKHAPIIALIVSSLSASGITTAWFLAPMLT